MRCLDHEAIYPYLYDTLVPPRTPCYRPRPPLLWQYGRQRGMRTQPRRTSRRRTQRSRRTLHGRRHRMDPCTRIYSPQLLAWYRYQQALRAYREARYDAALGEGRN